jgi:phenylalanyl-tRNA synthetase beta chain
MRILKYFIELIIMPVISFTYQNLEELLQIKIDPDQLVEMLPMIGSDVEGFDEEQVKVEFFPNRPDYLSVEGVSRTLKGFLGLEEGLPIYNTINSGLNITTDRELEDIRPYIACCIVEDVEFNEEKLKQVMDFQEDLHWVMGRDRKKVAIGIHNLDVVEAPFYYQAADPDQKSFIPLECAEELTLRDILEKHPKGRAYAHIIKDFPYYPLIVDRKGQVLSMPPIINGELTKLTLDTKNILIDVTGTDRLAVEKTLIIIATSFAEAGAQIKTMEVLCPGESRTLPDLTPRSMEVNVQNASQVIGVDLTPLQVVKALDRVRIGGRVLDDSRVQALIPAYRVDILHELDVVENIAIGYSFQKLKPLLPQVATVSREDPRRELDQNVREIFIGMGMVEVMSLMLTNEKSHYQNMCLEEDERVEVSQPISQDRTMIRQNLLNGLLEFLEHNKHEDLPQKIFEVGEVVYLDPDTETRTRGVHKLAALVTHSHANFTEIKSLTDTFLTNLGLEMEIDFLVHPSFVNGRCAQVKGVKKVNEGEKIVLEGYFGEINPQVITNFELEYPVIALELEFKI